MIAEPKPSLPNVIRARSGRGGSSFLIIGSEKSALIDAGMAFAGPELTAFVEETLSNHGRPNVLDYVILSHSHYDHIGGIPWLRRRWPELTVLGSLHCQQVLKRQGALRWIRSLASNAASTYAQVGLDGNLQYRDEELSVDAVIRDGDVIDLGETSIVVMESPGHTRCSLSFYLPLEDVLFPCETMGTIEIYGESIATGIMTSMEAAVDSLIQCRNCKSKHLVSPHFGFIHDRYMDPYWDWALKGIIDAALLFYECHQKGWSEDEILQAYQKQYCNGKTREEQPFEAFEINTRSAIRSILREMDADSQ